MFRTTLDGIGAIHLINANGKKQRALTQVSATNPTWAANGKEIYFSSDMLDNVEMPTLFAIDVNGGNVRKLANVAQACEEPAESPNGQWIAYVSTQGNNKDIHLHPCSGWGDPTIDARSGTGIFSCMGAVRVFCFTKHTHADNALGNLEANRFTVHPPLKL